MAMSLPIYGRETRSHLICGVCREVYRSPRLLPCHHSFCLDCLEGQIKAHRQVFPCPQCRNPTPVPKNGALGFQMNFHIPEEELELERNGPKTMPCPNHEEDQLLFFCVPCDEAICLRCQHDHHEVQDLREAVARCRSPLQTSKDRLEKAIEHLTKRSADVNDNIKNLTLKESALVKDVDAQRDAIVARVDKCCNKVKGDVRRHSQSMTSRLKQDAQLIQQKLDSLLQLRQRVHYALSAASDVETVRVEKDMRVGEGSEEELNKLKDLLPLTTMRPGVHRDVTLFNDDTIRHWLGSAVCLSLPFSAPVSEVITAVYQCGQEGCCREVHNVCRFKENLYVSFGGIAPRYAEEQQVCISQGRQRNSPNGLGRGKIFFRKDCKVVVATPCKPFNKPLQIGHSTSNYTVLVKYIEKDQYCSISRSKVASMKTFAMEDEEMFKVDCGKPTAFSATEDEQMFAIIEEKAQEHSVTPQLKVLLFRRGERQAFTTYTPPSDNTSFRPADLSFWTEEGQLKLLVADTPNDSVHVVSIQDNGCRFERHLAAGNGKLVGPTALDVDGQGHVWIGCSNGWILKREILSDVEMSDVTSLSDCPLQVENVSQSSETVSQQSAQPSETGSQPSAQPSETGSQPSAQPSETVSQPSAK